MPGTFHSLRADAFQVDTRDLLFSLTGDPLIGFDNPQKGKSTFHFARDARFFLKSVGQTEERNFFFDGARGESEWSWADYERSKYFNGCFVDYYRYMMEQMRGDTTGEDGVPNSFMPKFHLLFEYQVGGYQKHHNMWVGKFIGI